MTEKDKKAEGISLADIAKKVVYTSLGSASLARDIITDPSKSREVLAGLLNFAEKRKDDILDVLAREVSKFLGKIDVSQEISKALKGLVIDIQASINFEEQKGKRTKPRITINRADAKKTSR